MIIRFLAMAGAVTLSASAQTPDPPSSSGGVCKQIAEAAYAANVGLSTANTVKENSAPYVGQLSPAARLTDSENVERELIYRAIPADIYGDYVRWLNRIGLLPHEGEMLEIMASQDFGAASRIEATGAFLKSALTREGLICAFDNRLHETYRAGSPESADSCGSLLSDGGAIIEAAEAVPAGLDRRAFWKQRETDPNESEYPYNGGGAFTPEGIVNLDVDGDGVTEKLVRVTWSSLGDRCTSTYYDVLDAQDPTRLSRAPVRERVREAQAVANNPTLGGRCGRETRLRKRGDRVLFELSGFGPVVERGEPLTLRSAGPLERTLRDVVGGKTRTLCTTTFAVEPVVRWSR